MLTPPAESRLTEVSTTLIVSTVDRKALKQRRLALGYSQSQFAALLHVHVLTVSKWERGLHPIPESVALLLQHLPPKKGGTKRSK